MRAHAAWGEEFEADGGALWRALASGDGPPAPAYDSSLGHSELLDETGALPEDVQAAFADF